MSGTATKTIRQRLQEQINECRREADAIKASRAVDVDYELAFILLEKADELEVQLAVEMKGGVI